MAHITASPHGEVQGSTYPIDGSTACMSPLSLSGRFPGFYIKSGTLFVFDQQARQWLGFAQVDGLPQGAWVRFTDAEGHVLIPMELKLDAGQYYGRWLDQADTPMATGILDALRGPSGTAAPADEATKHRDVMAGRKTFGGWIKDGDAWIPPRT